MTGRFAAVVPAAGLSSRMDGFKPLLPLGCGTVLGCVALALKGAGVEHITAVAGHRADEVRDAAAGLGLDCVVNPDFQRGMFTSILAGLAALPGGFDGIFVLPVDIPLVRAATVRALMDNFRGRTVLYPTFQGERGHPPLLSREILPQVLGWDGTDGLRGALAQVGARSGEEELAVADGNILFDMDRPEDYREALRRDRRAGRPSPAETAVLLDLHDMGERGRDHARAVAGAARCIALALNSSPVRDAPPLDLELTGAAALLHDLAKGRPNHEAEGGRILDAAGFPDAARIVEAHRDIDLPPDRPITEREVVYLADKLVSCDRPVDVRARFQEKLDRFGHDPGAAQAILGRRDRALAMLTRIEAESGLGIEAILGSRIDFS